MTPKKLLADNSTQLQYLESGPHKKLGICLNTLEGSKNYYSSDYTRWLEKQAQELKALKKELADKPVAISTITQFLKDIKQGNKSLILGKNFVCMSKEHYNILMELSEPKELLKKGVACAIGD